MTHRELKMWLDPGWKSMSKATFIDYARGVDGRTRVGGVTGKGRITAKRALALLGVPIDSIA